MGPPYDPSMGPTPFDAFMYSLPYWLPAAIVGLVVQWLIVRSAAVSALRKHDRDRLRHAAAGLAEPDAGAPAPPRG
jgi:hypothetical protein